MQKSFLTFVIAFATMGASFAALPAVAQDTDAIEKRQELMKENGRSARGAGQMIQGEVAFDPATAATIFTEMHDVAEEFGDFFPEDSRTGAETEAAPSIWERPEEWQAALAKFEEDTQAAIDAAPQDVDAFRQVFGRVAENCRGCHEEFRIETDD